MAKSKTFFNILQKHSEAKLKILDNYVITWMRKITLGPYGNRALVIDGFSGTGVYDNNKDGSPIRLIKHAIDFCEQAENYNWPAPKILFLFIEGDEDNYDKLLENIFNLVGLDLDDESGFKSIPSYPSIQIACLNGSFEEVLSDLLGKINSNLIPSFCFIDPFGFSSTPFELIEKYVSNDRSEVFLNFIYEETNRFLTAKDPKIQEHMKRHFGIVDGEILKDLVQNKKGKLRKEVIVDFYARQLLENTEINHVLTFEIKKNGRTKLILFYGTKSLIGLKVMKKAMWKVDDTGLYMFDDRKSIDDIQFEFTKELDEAIMISDLADKIYNSFRGKLAYIEEIEEFVLTDTIYPVEVYAKKALVKLENNGAFLEVRNRKNKRTFPKNTLILFN